MPRKSTTCHVTPGGATTTGPDSTPPELSAETCGGRGAVGAGGQLGPGGGGSAGGWGGVLAARGGGGVHATHYYHMHTSRVCVCLGAWGSRGMYAIIAISHLCPEESLKGLKHQRHSNPLQRSMGEQIWRCWRHGPHTAIFQNSGGRGGGRGWGVLHTKTGPGRPPGTSPRHNMPRHRTSSHHTTTRDATNALAHH